MARAGVVAPIAFLLSFIATSAIRLNSVAEADVAEADVAPVAALGAFGVALGSSSLEEHAKSVERGSGGGLDHQTVLVQISSFVQEHLGDTIGSAAADAIQAAVFPGFSQHQVHSVVAGEAEPPHLHLVLQKVIGKISGLEDKIKLHHRNTQEALDNALSTLNSTTLAVVNSYSAALAEDSKSVSCATEEQVSLKVLEGATTALVDAEDAKSVECFRAYHTTECSDATIEVERREVVAEHSQHSSLLLREECLLKKKASEDAKCHFGGALQEKCTAAARMRQLVLQVSTVNGTEHSQPDRVQEWQVARMTKCVLAVVLREEVLEKVAVDTCRRSVDYERDVGTSGLQQESMEALLTPEKFTCEEEAISFSSDETSAVNTQDGQAPFVFCGAENSGEAQVLES